MKLLLNTAWWWALCCCLAGIGASAQAPLSLRQAILDALGANPQAKLAGADTREAKAGAALARTRLLPQLNFTEDISRGDDPVYVFGSRLRQQSFTQADFDLNALNRPLPTGNFATRFSGSWMLFDSLKTEREIRGADLYRQSAAAAGKAVDQAIVLRVVAAYQSVLYSEREVDVARHEQQTAQALLTQVDQHVKAGLAVDSDGMAAEVNLAARKEELIAAQGDLQIAWAELGNAMGAPDLQPAPLTPNQPHAFPQSSLQDELALALKTRPDLKALSEARQAQDAAVGAARSSFGPTVSAYGDWEQDRPTFTGSGGGNWVAGLRIGIDILPLAKRDRLAQASAARQRIEAQHLLARQQIWLDVSRAHIRRQTAELSLDTARAAMAQSAENLRILGNRYNAGLATITDLLRAGDAERQSRTDYWHAVYGSAMAYAQLLYAEGTLTPDAAEVLQ